MKGKRKRTRWLSISLVMLMIVQLFTMYGYAEEMPYENSTAETTTEVQDDSWTIYKGTLWR